MKRKLSVRACGLFAGLVMLCSLFPAGALAADEPLAGQVTGEEGAISASQPEEAAEAAPEAAQAPFAAGTRSADDAVLYLSFEANTIQDGHYLDLSGSGHPGEIVGNPAVVPGISGDAVYIDNGDAAATEDEATQYINLGQAIRFGTEDFSFSLWVKHDEGYSNDSTVFSNKDYRSGGNNGFVVGAFNHPTAPEQRDIRINMNAGGVGRRDVNRIPATDGNWHHIGVVFDRTAGRMIAYLNGAYFGEADISDHAGQTIDTGLDLVIGADGNKIYSLARVAVDELWVYKRTLSADEMASLYRSAGYEAILEDMRVRVEGFAGNPEFTQASIEEMKAKLNQTAQDILAEPTIEGKLALLALAEDAYDAFLYGAQPLAAFFAVSDVHVDSNDSNTSNRNFATGLQDMQAIDESPLAFIAAGDNTDYGSRAEVESFFRILGQYNPVGDEGTFVALGNHDVRGSYSWSNPNDPNDYNWEIPYWDTAYSLYMEFNGRYMPETNGEVYFDRIVDGYHFLVMNTEAALKDKAKITDTQLEWLEERLAATAGEGKPVFLTLHQPIPDTVWRSNAWDLGDSSDALKAILKKNPHVVFISGHIHNGLGVAEVIDREYGTMVDMPAYKGSENGYTAAGAGYYVKIYDDRVAFRARNFVTGTWLTEYDVTITLPSLPVLYQQAKDLDAVQYTEESWQTVAALVGRAEGYLTRYYEAVGPGVWQPPTVALYGREIREMINALALELRSAIEVLELKVTSLAILQQPAKVRYKLGEEFDASGLVIEAICADESRKTIDTYMLDAGAFNSAEAGEYTLYVRFGGAETQFTVEVYDPGSPLPYITGIKIAKEPAKLEYLVGEPLDLSGIEMMAEYSDGTQKPMDTSDVIIRGFTSNTAGEYTISLTYLGFSASFKVTVKDTPQPPEKELTGIKISSLPNKISYTLNEKLDTTGLVVTALYYDGSEEAVHDYTLGGFSSAASGKKSVTVSYRGFSASFTVTVSGKPGTPGTESKTYTVLEGTNIRWTGSGDAVIRIDADAEKLAGVRIGGTTLEKEKHYTVENGSTKITLLAGYLATLADGEYTVEVLFTDGSASARLTMATETGLGTEAAGTGENTTATKTGDENRLLTWGLLCLLLLMAVTMLCTAKRKRTAKHN